MLPLPKSSLDVLSSSSTNNNNEEDHSISSDDISTIDVTKHQQACFKKGCNSTTDMDDGIVSRSESIESLSTSSMTTASTESNDTKQKDKNKKKNTKKVVTFNPLLEKVRTIPPIHHMTNEEWNATYYDGMDYHRMDRDNGYVVYMIENNRPINHKRYCVRGLEHETNCGKNKLIQRIQQAQLSVFRIQSEIRNRLNILLSDEEHRMLVDDSMDDENNDDDTRIASCNEELSLLCLQEAYLIGLEDERAAAATIED